MIDWKEKTLAHWQDINILAVRRFGDDAIAEEAALSVIEELQAEDWKKVRSFTGKSSFAAFIGVVASRLLEDFARRRYGRIRAPLWVRSFGGIWEKLYNLLCLRRMSVTEAVETLRQNAAQHYSELEEAAYLLLERIPHCGQHQGLEVSYDEMTDTRSAAPPGSGNSYEHRQREELFNAVFALVFGSSDVAVTGELFSKFKELQLAFTVQETLMLKLCYQEEMSVSGAGKLLGMNRFQAHGKMRRLLKRIKDEFARVGLTDDLKQYL